MTAPRTHIFHLIKWGRVLAKHGVLKGIEVNAQTPAALRRLCRLARFGARVPAQAQYAHALEAIGPAAIKLGQTLATRPDLIGEAAADDLSRLQDALAPAAWNQVRPQIELALGQPIDALFASFDTNAVAAASIAQVHKATTPDGRTVAVKVLRPGISAQFMRDIETYEWAAAQIAALGGEFSRLTPREVIATFKQWTIRELDLRREAASASELADHMRGVPGYIVPAIDWERTSRAVLTSDWIDGIKLTDTAALDAAGHDRKALAATLVRAFLTQAIVHGFFHADVHPGNLFVTPQGEIAAVDFGIMGRINKQARLWLAEILHGLITGDYQRVAEIHFDAGYVPAHHNIDDFA
ncbi:MAG: ubiquinone biosynthesis protein UbiB, partial [Alphaproteobacteria bacterium]|nr:ubiquinone biosynthesis protein UbiB [Alphaproteobacteria bacterium]